MQVYTEKGALDLDIPSLWFLGCPFLWRSKALWGIVILISLPILVRASESPRYITAFASVFAYLWLYLIVDVFSPGTFNALT